MNTSKETNINVRLNPVDENTKFRILYDSLEPSHHKKYITQYQNNDDNEWKTLLQYKEDTKEAILAQFSSLKKARRFMRKILIANNLEIPEEFLVNDNI